MNIKILVQRFSEYSKFIKGYSPRTIQRYKHTISYFCNHAQISEIEEVTDENTRNLFYYGRTSQHWSANTYICYHKSLLVFFRWCIKEGFMNSNPVADIEIPKLERKLPSKLTKQDAQKILEVVDNYPYGKAFLRFRNYAIFATLIYTGIRKGELLNLKYTDVDVENLSIFIRQGKGNKDRVIPINYRLAESLQKYLELRNKAYKTCPEFFTSYTHDMGLTESGLKRLVARIVKTSGIKFSLHKLRHTFATLMLEGGCDIYSLSRMMGHSDIKTTTIYLAASAQHLREQILKHPLN
ncbi:MAG: tyrosine-type recombinase/integrase [Bacteroidetes bacterium]|nr:tyrosine-type recombinase/integrase [Bacteroidota bacterium]